ncbi:TetR/AcrR family transcriptional regulator [Thermophilibacter sp.]
MRAQGGGRAAARMRERLAEAFWEVLADARVDDVSVGAVALTAGVSRGSFYYHFADRDELMRWALRREILDADRAGTPLMQLIAAEGTCAGEAGRAAERTVHRLCLLIDHGGMDVVYDAIAEVTLDYWRAVLRPDGGRLPDGIVAGLEYDVGGLVGMLCRAGSSTDDERRSSLAFLRDRHVLIARRVCHEAGITAEQLRARMSDLESRTRPVPA